MTYVLIAAVVILAAAVVILADKVVDFQEQLRRDQTQREQMQREDARREQAQRERAQRERAQRERAQRERAQRERAQRERAQREQAQRERAQRERAQREQAQRREESIKSQMRSKFDKIHERIESFRLMVLQKKQCLFFFETYSHTRDSLEKSPELSTIHSHMRSVQDHIGGWRQAGQLTDPVIECYEQLREDIIQHRDRVLDELNRREPTFFEQLKLVATVIAEAISEYVPSLKAGLKLLTLVSGSKFLLPASSRPKALTHDRPSLPIVISSSHRPQQSVTAITLDRPRIRGRFGRNR